MRLRAALTAALLVAILAPAADAADPGRWRETGLSTIPLEYYQGMTHDPQRNLYFDGIHVGLYRTDSNLRETARNNDVIPPSVHVSERYNHIGDISWDAREGGRILLPLECYYPRSTPNAPDQNNPCLNGAIGVADPNTLSWRYYVKLDPAEIPKAMWAEISPDGELIWTSSGRDLLAYRTADVNAGNAAPGPLIRSVRQLRGAVPPTGITGAAFRGGRLYVAGQNQNPWQVWSIDLATGERRLEIEKRVVGESEGIDFVGVRGGELHWMVMPYNQEGPPTYGVSQGTLLHFVPTAAGGGPSGGGGPGGSAERLRLSVRPRRPVAGRRTRFRFRVTSAGRPFRGARVRFAGVTRRTNARGRASVVKRLRAGRRYRARATALGMTSGSAVVRVRRR